MGKHFVAMAGLHGCLPQYCEVHETYQDAVDDLSSLHELSNRDKRDLKRDGQLELDIRIHGNEYCEIEECNCDTPEVHSDSQD